MLSLIDDRHDAIRSEREEVMRHLAKDRFRQAILQVDAAVRMDEIVSVVVAEERRETETFDVQVSVRQKPGATSSERGANAVATVLVSVKREQFVAVEFVAIDRAQ